MENGILFCALLMAFPFAGLIFMRMLKLLGLKTAFINIITLGTWRRERKLRNNCIIKLNRRKSRRKAA